MRRIDYEEIIDESLVRGTLFLGEPHSGKTSSLARFIVEYRKRHPEHTICITDSSEGLSNKIFELILQEPDETRNWLLETIRYEEYGHPNLVVPSPEFSTEYGTSFDDQIERVKNNWLALAENMPESSAFLARLAIRGLAPELMKVLIGIRTEAGETWQITEMSQFLYDPKLLPKVFKKFEKNIPLATRELLTARLVNLKRQEEELRTYALTDIFEAIETPYMKAKLGYSRPIGTIKQSIEKGLLDIANCERLRNQKTALNYLVTQRHSQIMEQINLRRPDNPNDKPVIDVKDETYNALKNPGVAREIGEGPQLNRTRKFCQFIVFQAFSQLDEKLKEQIWSFGNIICFRLQNKKDAQEVAYQFQRYNPKTEKLPAVTETQNPVSEPEKGQDRQLADWICELPNRHFVMRRYISAAEKDKSIRYGRTKDLPNRPLAGDVAEVKEMLLRRSAIPIAEVLRSVQERTLSSRPRNV